MPFEGIIGQGAAVRAMQKAIEHDQVAGTYLLVGPSGVGKTTLALAFAQTLACLNPITSPIDACGECPSCRLSLSGEHPEIVCIAPAGDQTQIWQFWDRDGKPPGALQRTLRFAPVVGRRRVFIIERADTLNESAANSLLKVLEEPPPYAAFLLLAPHPARLLPTILSRSQMLRLAPVPVDSLASELRKRYALGEEQSRLLATYAEGRPGVAITLAGSSEAQEEISRVTEFAISLPETSPLAALRSGEAMRKVGASLKALSSGAPAVTSQEDDPEGGSREKLGRKQLAAILDLMTVFYRDLLALRLGGADARIAHASQRERLSHIARHGTPERWMECLEALLAARRRVDQNANVRLLTDCLALELAIGQPRTRLNIGS